jgi:hypothetical protein
VATRQEIDKLADKLAIYMETQSTLDWDSWMGEFMTTPLVSSEYAKVREMAKEIKKGRETPVIKELR